MTTKTPDPDRLMTVPEVAAMLSVPETFVRRLRRERRLPAIPLGKRTLRFSEAAVRAYIANSTQPPA